MLMLPHCDVEVLQMQGDRVKDRPRLTTSVFISTGHRELNRCIPTGLRHGIIAGTLVMVKLPIVGRVVWVTVHVADGGVRFVTSQIAALNFANLSRSTRSRLALHSIVASTVAPLPTSFFPEHFPFLIHKERGLLSAPQHWNADPCIDGNQRDPRSRPTYLVVLVLVRAATVGDGYTYAPTDDKAVVTLTVLHARFAAVF